MKRDMDLIRTILLNVEADETLTGAVRSANLDTLGITDRTVAEVTYNSVLLVEAGFLVGEEFAGHVLIFRLTWEGHEFLDSVRNPETWLKTKEGAHKIGSWSVSLLSDMANRTWPRPTPDTSPKRSWGSICRERTASARGRSPVGSHGVEALAASVSASRERARADQQPGRGSAVRARAQL